MIDARKLDQLRSWDPLRKIPSELLRDKLVPPLVENEGGDVDRGEDVSNVDLFVHFEKGDRFARTDRHPLIATDPSAKRLILSAAWDRDVRSQSGAPPLADIPLEP